MKLLTVRYGRERGHDDPEQAAGFRHAAEKIASVPVQGLLRCRASVATSSRTISVGRSSARDRDNTNL